MSSGTVSLSELGRAMSESPLELRRAKMLNWAIELVEDRLAQYPANAPCRERYEVRLAILKATA